MLTTTGRRRFTTFFDAKALADAGRLRYERPRLSMHKWLSRWFSRSPSAADDALRRRDLDAAIRTSLADALRESFASELEAMEHAHDTLEALRATCSELAESARKLARAQGRTALRVEEIERRVLAAAAEVSPPRTPETPASPAEGPLASASLLFDALDLLDHAVTRVVPLNSPGLADGLLGVSARLAAFLGANGYERIAPEGESPDGTIFEVVGTEASETVPRGAITRVVRAALRYEGRIVRAGQVLTAADQEDGLDS